MIEFEEARRRILDGVPEVRPEKVGLAAAMGRYLTQSIRAGVPVPAFDNSAMDGYAVRAVEASAGAVLRIQAEQAAGRDMGLELESGAAIRIFTGAPLPKGADAVVMQEDSALVAGEGVRILEGASAGEFVRRRAADLCEGQEILDAGARLNARRIGLLASQGLSEVEVGRRARVRVLTTGDELVEPGQVLGDGEIYNSNGPMLMAQVGHSEVDHRHVSDDLRAVTAAIAEGLNAADALVIAGGVSVGARDYVKQALAAVGVESEFWRVRMKPGKPFFYGELGEKRVFGLPGNPVSAAVTFHTLVRPALLKWEGRLGGAVVNVQAVAAGVIANHGDRPHFVRGFFDGRCFLPTGLQQSHAVFGLGQSNALLWLEEHAVIVEGQVVEVDLLDAFF